MIPLFSLSWGEPTTRLGDLVESDRPLGKKQPRCRSSFVNKPGWVSIYTKRLSRRWCLSCRVRMYILHQYHLQLAKQTHTPHTSSLSLFLFFHLPLSLSPPRILFPPLSSSTSTTLPHTHHVVHTLSYPHPRRLDVPPPTNSRQRHPSNHSIAHSSRPSALKTRDHRSARRTSESTQGV